MATMDLMPSSASTAKWTFYTCDLSPQQPTSLEVFLQASAAGVQLLLGQGEGPFTGKLWEVEVGKLPLQVLVQDGKLPVAL